MYYCMERSTLPWDEYRTDQYFTCRVEDAVTVGTYTMSDVAEKKKTHASKINKTNELPMRKKRNSRQYKESREMDAGRKSDWTEMKRNTWIYNPAKVPKSSFSKTCNRAANPYRASLLSSSKRYKSKKYTNRCIDMSWTLEWTQAEYKWDQSISKGLPHLKFLETANAALDAKPGKNAAITCTIVYYLQLQLTPNIVMATMKKYKSKNRKA